MFEEAREWISVEEYLERENAAQNKSEYFDGEIFAMAGGAPEHALIGNNVGAELRALLRGSGCRAYNSDVRIAIPGTGLRTYPDVAVVCGAEERDTDDPRALTNPVLLVEVLSPTTEDYDRTIKFRNYRRIPTFREYLLVASEEVRVEYDSREPGESEWSFSEFTSISDAVKINALGVILELKGAYADVEFSDAPVSRLHRTGKRRSRPSGNSATVPGPLQMVDVESSMVTAVGYDGAAGEMQVEFRSGEVWRYRGVPRELYEELLSAPSIGSYMRSEILGTFSEYPVAGRRRRRTR